MNQPAAFFREVPLPNGVSGRLWLHSMPGRFEPLEKTRQAIAIAHVTVVVCLAPRHELEAKSPDYARALEAGVPWTHVELPVPDFGVPEAPLAFYQQAEAIAAQLRSSVHVLVHCAAGVGRTGTFACVVLRALGLSLDQTLALVDGAGAGPETALQKALLSAYPAGHP